MYMGSKCHVTNSRFIILGHSHNSAENCRLPSQLEIRDSLGLQAGCLHRQSSMPYMHWGNNVGDKVKIFDSRRGQFF